MAMKGYFTLSRSSEMEPHHQMQFGVNTQETPFLGSYLFAENTVSVFLSSDHRGFVI